MKKSVLALVLLLTASCGFAQFGYYHDLRVSYEKYYIGASVGEGTAYWNSHMENNNLLNRDGSVLVNGDHIDFKSKNATRFADLNVQFPLAKIRYGFGLSFEEAFMDKLQITSQQNHIVLMNETFVFDKMYAQMEIPFFPMSKSPLSINGNVHFGYFGYHGARRLNYFGGDHLAKSFYVTLGFTVDYKLYPHTYVFLFPNYEYKYFRSSLNDYPANVQHNISTWVFSGGIRVDLSKE
ncbi:MAG TPA: hypothetical protein VGO45_03710 [Bacteroidia bacterium]|nr:hypothetical protein [Bacteroidia bacterium]